MFTRASNAVVKSLSWPRKRFLKWVRNDVVKAATAAENHLNLSDHNYQEPILPQVPASSQPSKAVISSLDHSNCNPVLDTLERSITSDQLSPPQSPSKGRNTGQKPASLNYSQAQAKKTLCQRYSSTGTGITSRTSDTANNAA
ncbi:hypothetical protein H2202_006448 [Exophiala xenobiotica]|nr:hypothetical protein H2202_006448 [Exophiala xenobiotica]